MLFVLPHTQERGACQVAVLLPVPELGKANTAKVCSSAFAIGLSICSETTQGQELALAVTIIEMLQVG